MFVDSVSAPLGCLSSPKLLLRRNLLIFSFICSTMVASVWKRFAVFPFCVSFIVRKHHLSCIYSVEELESVRDFSSFSFHINMLTVQTLGFTLECLLQIYTLCQEPQGACEPIAGCVSGESSVYRWLFLGKGMWLSFSVSPEEMKMWKSHCGESLLEALQIC